MAEPRNPSNFKHLIRLSDTAKYTHRHAQLKQGGQSEEQLHRQITSYLFYTRLEI